MLKRAFDLTLLFAGFPVWAPALLLGMAAVKLFSGGAVFFQQERYGEGFNKFWVVKLRTMIPNAEYLGAGIYAEQNDPRYTKIGLILRKLSIDELPQVINVFRGEMSLVGPRPMLPIVVHQYREEYKQILTVKPGITGLAQVSGRNELPRSKRLELDIQYAQSRTLLLDVRILAATLKVLLTASGQRNYQRPEEVER